MVVPVIVAFVVVVVVVVAFVIPFPVLELPDRERLEKQDIGAVDENVSRASSDCRLG